jgi:hypothetical protein
MQNLAAIWIVKLLTVEAIVVAPMINARIFSVVLGLKFVNLLAKKPPIIEPA